MKFMAKNQFEKKVPPIFTFWVVSYRRWQIKWIFHGSWLCPSDIPDPTIGSGIWVWNLGSGIFPDPRKFSRTRNFPLKPSFLSQNSPNSRFWARSIGLRRNSWFRGFSQGLEKFLTLDSGPKFRTRRMGPECQMGSAIVPIPQYYNFY